MFPAVYPAHLIRQQMGIDRDLLRPLYAMIITDAHCRNPDEIKSWDRKNVLDYICKREHDRIKARFQHLGLVVVEQAEKLLAMSTMVRGFDFTYEESPFEIMGIAATTVLPDDFYDAEELFRKSNYKSECITLEPDIIGEYFVLDVLLNSRNAHYMLQKARQYKNGEGFEKFITLTRQDHFDVLSSLFQKIVQAHLSPNSKEHLEFGGQKWRVIEINPAARQALLIAEDIMGLVEKEKTVHSNLPKEHWNPIQAFTKLYFYKEDIVRFDASDMKKLLKTDTKTKIGRIITDDENDNSSPALMDLFILSIEETTKYLPNSKDRVACYDEIPDKWWVRTGGDTGCYVNFNGYFYSDSLKVIEAHIAGIRPAVWVKY